MKAKVWILIWLAGVIAVFGVIGSRVYAVDPFFHYHAPRTEKYFYKLLTKNQRSQNDGISKHFTYDAMITGTSMAENFRTSEMDDLFGCSSIKVTYEGGSYKEVNDSVVRALKANPELKLVVRSLEEFYFLRPADDMRADLGELPAYLYDSNPFNDIKYLLNRDIVFTRTYSMMQETNEEGFKPGITSFDDYSWWQHSFPFGLDAVMSNELTKEILQNRETAENHLTEEERKTLEENIRTNLVRVAEEHPDTEFYYFFTPYSIINWKNLYNDGRLIKQVEAEKAAIELMLPQKNIHLFCFNDRFDITTDLNNYKDLEHYASWINSLILKWMHDGTGLLTEENYEEFLQKELEYYVNYDYESLNGQEDYEADFYAGALLNRELTGASPAEVLGSSEFDVSLSGAELLGENGKITGIRCTGRLGRESEGEDRITYIRDREYIGAKFTVDLGQGYNFLSFHGQKIRDHGQPAVYVYDEAGNTVAQMDKNYGEIDEEEHHYVMDLSGIKGKVTIIINGGYIDRTGSADSEYWFSDIMLY